jgi:hypothetical protein
MSSWHDHGRSTRRPFNAPTESWVTPRTPRSCAKRWRFSCPPNSAVRSRRSLACSE